MLKPLKPLRYAQSLKPVSVHPGSSWWLCLQVCTMSMEGAKCESDSTSAQFLPWPQDGRLLRLYAAGADGDPQSRRAVSLGQLPVTTDASFAQLPPTASDASFVHGASVCGSADCSVCESWVGDPAGNELTLILEVSCECLQPSVYSQSRGVDRWPVLGLTPRGRLSFVCRPTLRGCCHTLSRCAVVLPSQFIVFVLF